MQSPPRSVFIPFLKPVSILMSQPLTSPQPWPSRMPSNRLEETFILNGFLGDLGE